jgi:hypothetical protein
MAVLIIACAGDLQILRLDQRVMMIVRQRVKTLMTFHDFKLCEFRYPLSNARFHDLEEDAGNCLSVQSARLSPDRRKRLCFCELHYYKAQSNITGRDVAVTNVIYFGLRTTSTEQ